MKTNIVYIVLDDAGYSDLGCYGSEIQTPRMDELAANGLRYNDFCATPLCSPTRASLLTGRNHHSVGVGSVTHLDLGPNFPNTRGRIDPSAGTLAEILRLNGFQTFAVGKWHLAPVYQSTPAGPFDHWPLRKGFDRFYGFMEGSTDQYRPELIRDNHKIECPRTPDYHLSEDLVDRSIEYAAETVSVYPDKPFFLYLCFGAPHAPHQVRKEYIDRYKGVYDKGWDHIREQRFLRQKAIGLIPESTELVPRNEGVKAWEELTENERALFVRLQETYAGFMTHTDEQIGRFIDRLREIGELDNTLIVLLSDNGASMEGGDTGSINQSTIFNPIKHTVEEQLAFLEDIGGPGTSPNYPKGWAQAGNTPFRNYKQNTHFGGVRVPFIVHWPHGIEDTGGIRRQFHHVIDVTPTVLELLDIAPPEQINGVPQMPMHGISMAYTFADKERPTRRTTQYFLIKGHRAIWHEGWRAVTLHRPNIPFGQDRWELYHIEEDFSEAKNVAEQFPEKLAELIEKWWEEAGKYGALPLSEKTIDTFAYSNPDSPAHRNTFVFYPEMGHLGAAASPRIQNRSYIIAVHLDSYAATDRGVLVAMGNHNSGYSLYIAAGHLHYEYNYFGRMYGTRSEFAIPEGDVVLRFQFSKTGPHAGQGTLYMNDEPAGRIALPETIPRRISHEGLDIGVDSKSPVSRNYPDDRGFPFTGRIKKVTFDIADD